MTKKHQILLNLKSTVRAALIALGLAILFGKLDAPAAQLSSFLGLAAKVTLDLLPSLAFAFDHQWLSPCPVQMLVSSWPLLHAVAAAV